MSETNPDSPDTKVETGDVEGDVTIAPPPPASTPPAEDGQPDGDVKPKTDGDVDPQSSPENQELQQDGSSEDGGSAE